MSQDFREWRRVSDETAREVATEHSDVALYWAGVMSVNARDLGHTNAVGWSLLVKRLLHASRQYDREIVRRAGPVVEEPDHKARDENLRGYFIKRVTEEMARQDRRYPWPRPEEFLDDVETFGQRDVSVLRLQAQAIEEAARHAFDLGRPTWLAILAEEFGEACQETNPLKKMRELIQVAAVALSWAQALQEQLTRNGFPNSERKDNE